MMTEKGIPIEFRAEVVNIVAGKTPFEAFTRRKPRIKHLRVFGCICYSHVPSTLRQKLDNKVEKRVFMGYENYEKGYGVYILDSKKIVLSKSVIFHENKF